MACERKLIESEATTGSFVLLGTKGKKETLEWCMKANLIASRYECPRFKKICVCKKERERLTATNGVAATSRKIIATTLFGVTATAGSDVVQCGRPIIDDFFQHLWPYIGNNTANVVFQMVKRLWLIRIDQ
ncbi:hypothetical protein TNCV_668081 [Trichonephila clavipes]|nr:hypothetical protein TNCV_668081 [Trichonephila clavipes]